MALVTRANGSQVLVSNYAAQTLSNTTVETTVFTMTVPANMLETDKGLRVEYYGSLTTLLTPPTVTVKVKFGGMTLTAVNGVALLASGTAKPFSIEVFLANRGATNSQYCLARVTNPGAQGLLIGLAVTEQVDGTGAVDTTAAQTLSITVQFGTQISTTTLTTNLVRATIE